MTQYFPCPTCPTTVATNTEAYHGCVDCMKRKIQKLEKTLEAHDGTLNAIERCLRTEPLPEACASILRILNTLRKTP